VLLAGGLWFPVVAGTFELREARESSTREGAFGWGFSFCTGDHRLYGPVSSLTAIAVPL
jgi:hypothetical protein